MLGVLQTGLSGSLKTSGESSLRSASLSHHPATLRLMFPTQGLPLPSPTLDPSPTLNQSRQPKARVSSMSSFRHYHSSGTTPAYSLP